MSKYPPNKKKQQELENEDGFITDIKPAQVNSNRVVKSKKEETEDYLDSLWNRLNGQNKKESLKMVSNNEKEVMEQLQRGEVVINEKVENVDLITENYKMEKMEQQQKKDQLKDAERKKMELEMKLSQLDVDISILRDLRGSQSLKHVDLEQERQQQFVQEQKMKKIRIERKQLERKRQEIQREQEIKTIKEHEDQVQQKRLEMEQDKGNRVNRSKQNNEVIQNRLQMRDQEIEKFREEIKELKKNRPDNVVLKDDVMYKQLKEKKKQLKNVRDLMSNPIIHDDKNDIYKSNYESKYYRDYVNDYKVHKQVHVQKKQEHQEQEKKMKVLEEEIKRKHKPVKSAKLEKEMQDKIEYWDKDVKRPKRKLKGKEYEYIEPKKVDKKGQLKIGQEYMEKAKKMVDRNKTNTELASNLSEQEQKKQKQKQIQLQQEYEKKREMRDHDLKNLEQAKKRGRYQGQSKFMEDVMKDRGCSSEKKQMILKEHSEKLLVRAMRLEEEERMKNQSSTILDQNYYLGKKMLKNRNQSSQQLQSKTEHELIQREQVNDLYIDSIKTKIMMMKQKR